MEKKVPILSIRKDDNIDLGLDKENIDGNVDRRNMKASTLKKLVCQAGPILTFQESTHHAKTRILDSVTTTYPLKRVLDDTLTEDGDMMTQSLKKPKASYTDVFSLPTMTPVAQPHREQ